MYGKGEEKYKKIHVCQNQSELISQMIRTNHRMDSYYINRIKRCFSGSNNKVKYSMYMGMDSNPQVKSPSMFVQSGDSRI